jgi:drug/metabolite transporter (DMT)-like permease
VFLSGAFFLLAVSMRGGDMSVIAPFRYTALLFAIVLGYLVWGEVPNGLAWAGIALLVGAGVYVLHSERARARLALGAIRE